MNDQTYDFSKEWKEIENLEGKGLPKSALSLLDQMYSTAKNASNDVQLLKIFLKRMQIKSQNEEGAIDTTYRLFMEEIQLASNTNACILHSLLGKTLHTYLQNNIWRLQNRTKTAAIDSNLAIETWDIAKFYTEIQKHYLASVEQLIDRKVPTQKYNPLLDNPSEKYLLSIYDLLLYSATEYFKLPTSYLTEPTYKFIINKSAYFANANVFSTMELPSNDTTSSLYLALKLFQTGTVHHINAQNKEALLDLDIRRFEFLYQNSTVTDKKKLYQNALQNITEQFSNNSEVMRAYYLLAYERFKDGSEYHTNKDSVCRQGYADALKIIEGAVQKYPMKNTEEVQNLVRSIKMQSLSFQVEEVNLPNRPILCRTDVRSVPKIYARIYKVSNEELLQRFENPYADEFNEKYKDIIGKKPIVTVAHELQSFTDYQTHSTEIKVDALPVGTYLIGLSVNANFDSGLSEYKLIHVSNIAWISRNETEQQRSFMLLHRETGKALKKVVADIYQINYNNRKSNFVKIGTAKTDEKGYLNAKVAASKGSYFLRFVHEKDTLLLNHQYHNYGRQAPNPGHKSVMFFTDRSIYRPGQTVHFKGLAVNHINNLPQLSVGSEHRVRLSDVNGQEVSVLRLQSSEYGTFSGTFTLPEDGLTGTYSIACENGYQSIQVEAYKRPTFEVKINPIEGSYQLGSKIIAKGKALGYSGNGINNAEVRYRITRKKDYPYWPWWYGRWMPQGNERQVEIANGSLQTNNDGTFEVAFEAKKDDNVDTNNPRYLFEITADVVDQTGETRSAVGSVFVCATSFLLQPTIAEQVNKRSPQPMVFQTTNHNGQKVKTTVAVKISSLETPKQLYIKRYWEQPEYQQLTKNQFEKSFPSYSYQGEDLVQNWKTSQVVFNGSANDNDSLILQMKDWKVGEYMVEVLATGADGSKVETKKFFTLYDLMEKQLPVKQALGALLQTKNYEPTEKCTLYLASHTANMQVLLEVERAGQIQRSTWENIGAFASFDFPITEQDRGNFHLRMLSVKNNRFYEENRTIEVPWSNKDLQISYETFRDKLQPGQEEIWKLKISGYKKDKVLAEMLATMYDASLDQFVPHNLVKPSLFPYSYVQKAFEINCFGLANTVQGMQNFQEYIGVQDRLSVLYPTFSYNFEDSYGFGGGGRGVPMMSNAMMRSEAPGKMADKRMKDSTMELEDADAKREEQAAPPTINSKSTTTPAPVQVRTNLKETVFFFPNLQTDTDGNVIVKFKMNDALTKWKFMAFAHDKNLATAISSKELVTQKDLMILPNAPRFFREGDTIVFTGKVINLAQKDLYGSAKLEFWDALTGKDLNSVLSNTVTTKQFSIGAGLSQKVEWRLVIPNSVLNTLRFRISAISGDFTDAEENVIPVVSNRMLVTESLPLPVGPNQTKNFTLKSMLEGNTGTRTNQRFTLEFTPNPAWYAVKALPYLMEFPHECSEQLFNRFYSNSLATQIANSTPKISAVFDAWRNDPNALKSNLEQNPELKSALLEETPWVLAAQDEATQRKNIGLLFDFNKMAHEKQIALKKLSDRVNADGGFSWFPGGPSSDYITQYLVEGLGHLRKLGVSTDNVTWLNNAIQYIDLSLIDRYEKLKKQAEKKLTKLDEDHLDYLSMHYLYARSFFDQPASDQRLKEAKTYYLNQAKKYWRKGLYQEGLLALALFRNKETAMATEIVKSIKERSLRNEELGMYWKNSYGYNWYELPIETHALMIEVFAEIAKDDESVLQLKTWLLKNKQTNNWSTTKGTAGAIYALLMTGDKWLESEQLPVISLGSQQVDLKNVKKEAGSGYFKIDYSAPEIRPEMANIKVENKNPVPAWGAVYLQYFEQLDKIKAFKETPLTLVKQYYIEVNTPTGPILEKISDSTILKPGDKLKVRIELRVDREMEYIHLKDMRPSNTEPMNVISQYKWQDGLGYYESTKDLASHFFISNLPKGTYVFEYPIRVIHQGTCSTGIATIQSMYAPEFSSHSNGLLLKVGQ